MYLCIELNKYLLSIYVFGVILGVGDMVVNKVGKVNY